MSIMTDQDLFSAWEAQMKEKNRLLDEVMPANKAALFAALGRAGITTVTVYFDGNGDEGQIEEIYARSGEVAVELPSEEIEMTVVSNSITIRTHYQLDYVIEHIVYDVLAAKYAGWEINDGSDGEFTFDVQKGTITLDFYKRHMESEHFEYLF